MEYIIMRFRVLLETVSYPGSTVKPVRQIRTFDYPSWPSMISLLENQEYFLGWKVLRVEDITEGDLI